VTSPVGDPARLDDRLYSTPREVASIDDCLFYHSIDLPESGTREGLWDLRGAVDAYLGRVDFAGKRVLEVGPASGFLTATMEQRGAEVVAVELAGPDGFDLLPMQGFDMGDQRALRGASLEQIKNCFWFVHGELGLRAQVFEGPVSALPEEAGTFDVSLLGCVLLHARDPIGLVVSAARRTTGTVIVTDVRSWEGLDRRGEPVSVLYPTLENGVIDRWWTFSPEFFVHLLGALGFTHVRIEYHEQHAAYAGIMHPMFTVVASREPEGPVGEGAATVAAPASPDPGGDRTGPSIFDPAPSPAPVDAPQTGAAAAARKRAHIAANPRWFHSIDIGDGVVTPGDKSAEWLAMEFEALELPPLRGASVLDIGAWDGFFSYEAERRGASRVLALDKFVWGIDWPAATAYVARCKAEGTQPKSFYDVAELWSTALPGKRNFDLAHESLNSNVESMVGDFMTVDPAAVGVFDVVLFLGVIYHVRHPLLALERLREFTGGLAVIESYARVYPGFEHRLVGPQPERAAQALPLRGLPLRRGGRRAPAGAARSPRLCPSRPLPRHPPRAALSRRPRSSDEDGAPAASGAHQYATLGEHLVERAAGARLRARAARGVLPCRPTRGSAGPGDLPNPLGPHA
jgi:SAM-dependent methyltransferase